MSSERMRRVDEAIRQVIGDALASDLKDPRVGFVTVTDVRTSADLSHARVYVSVLGEAEARVETLAGLESAHGYLQARLARELKLKRTPTLAFAYDDTTDRAMRLDALIETEIEDRQPNGPRREPEQAGVEGAPGEDRGA
ncbi:MAG: 30S ribosome-binding factor RbfA [Solirubrobacteraceae bacterium]